MSSIQYRLWLASVLLVIGGITYALPSLADNDRARVLLTKNTMQNGLTVRNTSGTFLVGVPAHSLNHKAIVKLKLRRVLHPEAYTTNGETLISDLYTYRLTSKRSFQLNQDLWIALSYPTNQQSTNKVIKVWNKTKQRWQKLSATKDQTNLLMVQSALKRNRAVVGVFQKHAETVSAVVSGTASWYTGTVAASNAFPIGSRIRVTNKSTGQSVETVVGSTWSGDIKYGWLLDLPKEAFATIANLSSGLVEVTVEVLNDSI